MAQQTPPPGPPPGTPPPGGMGGPPMGGAGQPVDSQGRILAVWWKRAVAAIIDSIIVSIPSWILLTVLGVGLGATADPVEFDPVTGEITGGGAGAGFIATFLVSMLVIVALGIAYYIYFHGSEKGQTPGKMIMKLQLRDEATGGRVSYGKAGLRWLVAGVLWAICYIPGIVDALFPLWDPKRQTLHDKAANTLVIDLAP